MNILDAIIIIVIIVGALGGMSRGLIKEVVFLLSLIVCLVLSFSLRGPIATLMYKYLPFFEFSGDYAGVSILNILVYELIAFLIVFGVLYLIVRILLAISGLIEKLLKATIILGFFSKIGGAIVGAIEGYVLVFIILFVLNQPFFHITGMENSKVANFILDKTPLMSPVIEDTRIAIKEVYELSGKYKTNKQQFNKEAIKLFIKYDIISEENVEILREKGKLN